VVRAHEVDVIVVPLVRTTDRHHVGVLMMIIVDTEEHGLPITEILLSVDENLTRPVLFGCQYVFLKYENMFLIVKT